MLNEALWTRFQNSGSAADYLAYAAIKELEHADGEGHRPDAENTGRTGQVH